MGLEARPSLRGEPFASYSATLKRWLPARPEMVAPDSRHYAYKAPNGPLHLVNADTGSDQTVTNPNDLAPIGYSRAGVWLVQQHRGNMGTGLWLLDPASMSVTQVLAQKPSESWQWVRGDAIWGYDSDGLLGSPPPTSVLHFDIATRTSASWFSESNGTAQVVAIDIGRALVVDTMASRSSLLAVHGPQQSAPVTAVGDVTSDVLSFPGWRSTDARGGWLVNRYGVYLFKGVEVRKVGPGPSQPDIVPAGECA
jgi:hypothetical protein